MPDDICAGLYKYRKDLAEAWNKGQNFSAAGNALDDWGDATLEYKAFKPEALVKASGKISYAKFKRQGCGGYQHSFAAQAAWLTTTSEHCPTKHIVTNAFQLNNLITNS